MGNKDKHEFTAQERNEVGREREHCADVPCALHVCSRLGHGDSSSRSIFASLILTAERHV